MRGQKPPLNEKEEKLLQEFKNHDKIETICQTNVCELQIKLCKKFYNRTQNRQYVALQTRMEERLDFLNYYKSTNGSTLKWRYFDTIKEQYETILDSKEYNTNKIIEDIHMLHSFITDNTIKTITTVIQQ